MRIVSNKPSLFKLFSAKFSHHVRIIDKSLNRSDKQEMVNTPRVKHNVKHEHMFDEIYVKGRGGPEWVAKDKEGLKDNFDEIINRTITSKKPNF
jgi:hypothetical protein